MFWYSWKNKICAEFLIYPCWPTGWSVNKLKDEKPVKLHQFFHNTAYPDCSVNLVQLQSILIQPAYSTWRYEEQATQECLYNLEEVFGCGSDIKSGGKRFIQMFLLCSYFHIKYGDMKMYVWFFPVAPFSPNSVSMP